jgi:hypothetical protein
MTGKTKYLSVVAAIAVVGLGVIGIRHRESPSPTLPAALPTPQPVAPVVANMKMPQSPGFTTLDPDTKGTIDPQDWVQNGPKEPLVPPVIHVDVDLAPGSVLTAEPLVPKELQVDVELAPGETLGSAPLTPREIHADGQAQ